MDEHNSPELRALTPHHYPLILRLFALGLLVAFCYSLTKLPYYLELKAEIDTAEQYFQGGRYDEAVDVYRALYRKFPCSTKIKIRLAEAYFSLQRVEEGGASLAGCQTFKR